MLAIEGVAISMLEQHLEMHRVDFGFNPEENSQYTFDFSPELVSEVEDLLEHAALLYEHCIESLPRATEGIVSSGYSRIGSIHGRMYYLKQNYEKALSASVRSLLIRQAIFGRDKFNHELATSLRTIGWSD